MCVISPSEKRGQWKKWNAQGFFPGPFENEADLIERIDFCKTLALDLDKSEESPFSFLGKADYQPKALLETLAQAEEFYGICPDWVLIFFSDYKLTPWQGGSAWIFQLTEGGPIASFLQLKSILKKRDSYLKIYSRKELIIHEIAHIGRMALEEPKYEEFFAYQSSCSAFRRWFGPVIQSSLESLMIVVLLLLIVLLDFTFLYYHLAEIHIASTCLKGLMFGFILCMIGRLFLRHQTYRSCLKQVAPLCKNLLQAKHFVYRLRDAEIKQFTRLSTGEISAYIEKESLLSFRWNFLKNIYLE